MSYSQSSGKTEGNGKTYWFMQPPGTSETVPLNFRNMCKTIPKDDKAYSWIDKYRHNRRINRVITATGIGLFVAAITTSENSDDLATGLFIASIPVFTFSITRGITNSFNKKRALADYNGVLKR